PGPDGGRMKSSPIGVVSLSGTPAIHPVLASGMKLGMAEFSAIAGQLSVAAAITPASRPRDLLGDFAFVLRFIGVPSLGDYAATRFSQPFYRKQSGRRHGFTPHAAATRMLAIVALRCKSWSTKTLRQAQARRVGKGAKHRADQADGGHAPRPTV